MNAQLIVIISVLTMIAIWYRPDYGLFLGFLITLAVYVLYRQHKK